MKIIINNNTYYLDNMIWEKHKIVHPVRPEDALKSNIQIVFADKEITENGIKNMIEDEYNMFVNINDTIEKARKIYG